MEIIFLLSTTLEIMKTLQIKQSITDRSDTALKSYLKDISKIPLLTPEQEKEIAAKAKLGDKKAIDKLVTSNLRFVVSVAKQYQGQGIDLIDLINEGNMGIMEAAKRFDVDRGFRFISYAVWWIRQSIVSALSSQSRTIRFPSNQVHLISKINKTIAEFEQKYERKPSNEELENILGIPSEKISYILSASSKTVSVDSPLKDEEEGTLVDVIPNHNSPHTDEALREESKNKEIAMILKRLSYREHDIIRMFFGLGCDSMTLENISTKFGLTSERVRQVKDSAIKSLQGKHLEYVKKVLNK